VPSTSVVACLTLGFALCAPFVHAESASIQECRCDIGELTAGRVITQTLVATEDCLEAIEVVVATYGRHNACFLHVVLRDEATGRAIAERHLSCAALADGSAAKIGFPMQGHSRGRKYRLTLASADAKPGQAVTVKLIRDPRSQGEVTEGSFHYGADLEVHLVYRYGTNSNYMESWRRMRLRWLKLATILTALTFVGHLGIRWRRQSAEATGTGVAPAALGFGPWLLERRFEVAFATGLFFLYQLAAPHQQFCDEFDSLSGGLFVKLGLVPYKDFFSHHMPLPYFVAAGITLFTGNDLWALRSVFQFLLFLWCLGICWLLRRHVGSRVAVLFGLFAPLAMFRSYGFMLLGETLIAYSSVSLMVLLLFRFRVGHVLTRADVAVVSLLTFLIAISSLAWVHFVGLIYAWFGWKYVAARTWRAGGPAPWTTAGLLALPHGLFLLYLWATRSLAAFYLDNVQFNVHQYAQFCPEVIEGNPLIMLTAIVSQVCGLIDKVRLQFFQSEHSCAVYALLAGVALTGYLMCQNRYGDAGFFVAAFILVGPRGGAGQDWFVLFHGTPFILVVVLAGSIAAFEIPKALAPGHGLALRIAYGFLVPFLALAVLDNMAFSAGVYWTYWGRPASYMMCRTEPVAEVINALTDDQDYVWIGPFQLDTVVQLRARPASYYAYFLPWVAIQEGAQERVIRDLQAHEPKVVLWKPNENWWNWECDAFSRRILEYLDAHYFVVDNPRDERLRFLHFPKDRRAEIMQELARLGHVAK
jgi:hypothetical protein